VFPDQLDEILRRISGECRFTEMRIARDEILGPCVDVCEVTASATRDNYLSPHLGVMLKHQDSAPTLSRLDRTKKPGCTAADDDKVVSQGR